MKKPPDGPLARVPLTPQQRNIALVMKLAGSSLDAEVAEVAADNLGSQATADRWVQRFGLSISKPGARSILRAYGYEGQA